MRPKKKKKCSALQMKNSILLTISF